MLSDFGIFLFYLPQWYWLDQKNHAPSTTQLSARTFANLQKPAFFVPVKLVESVQEKRQVWQHKNVCYSYV